jgi:transposase InsO family protein
MIQSIKACPPCWAYLYFREGIKVNQRRIYRLMTCWLIRKHTGPNYLWGTDGTKIRIGSWGWYYLVIVLDWYTKEIMGYHVSLPSKSKDWKEALEEAVGRRFPKGIKESQIEPLVLVSDNS